jgi:hypothetical protein
VPQGSLPLIPSVIDPPRASRRTAGLIAAGWIVLLVTMSIWLRTPSPFLREQLKVLQFWSLEACLVLVLLLGGIVLRDLCAQLDRRDVRQMVLLSAAAVALVLLVAPRTHRIYFDEQIYQSVGQNLSDAKLAQMCNDGTVEYGRLQCWSGEYNKQPYAYPHALSVVYRAFGVSGWTAFAFNTVVMALTVCGVYLLVLTAFAERSAAFFAALIVLLIPQQLLWSATAAVEPSASLACLAAVLAAAAFRRSGGTTALAATGVATAYAVQFRPESFLIAPVVVLLLWPRIRQELTAPRLWAVGLLSAALIGVHVVHLAAVRHEGWGASDARLSLEFVLPNLRVNGPFYLGDERFPVMVTALAVVGLAAGRAAAIRHLFGIYFLLFFGMYLLFYAGSYDYGADVRYSVMTYVPISVLGGLGAARVAGWLGGVARGIAATRLVTAGLLFQALCYGPIVRATTEEAWAARADVQFAESFAADLPRNSYVLTHNPGMFHVWGVNAGQMSAISTSPGQLEFLAIRYTGGVYLHWNFWCNVPDPVQQRFCLQAMEGRRLEVVREHREREQRYVLYRYGFDVRAD